ncbi:hypothetical protein PMAYCL1PPCAC_14154, partial [Pristionchus mayeri]
SPDGKQSVVMKKFACKTVAEANNVLRELNCLNTIRHEHILDLKYKYEVKLDNTLAFYHITLYCGVPLSKKIEEGQYSMMEVKR